MPTFHGISVNANKKTLTEIGNGNNRLVNWRLYIFKYQCHFLTLKIMLKVEKLENKKMYMICLGDK